MLDRITIHGLTGHGHHGVYDVERERGQTFRVDAVLELDTAPAAARDDLALTVNYAELSQRLHALVTGEPVDLIETLAQRLADVCLGYELVQAVEITVHKPDADLGVPAADVTVAIRRERTQLPPPLARSPRAPELGREAESNRSPR
ncbi:dihydroneopterin aldolase [Modestobacter sp. URMC 112]